MAWVEEVFENNGEWYGGRTGHKYEKSETEEKGCCRWSKPAYAAPGEIVLEIEEKEQSTPSGNGPGYRGC